MYLAGFLFLINFRKVIIVPGLIATISLRHTSSVEETDSFGQTFFLFGLFDSKYFLLYDSKHSFSFLIDSFSSSQESFSSSQESFFSSQESFFSLQESFSKLYFFLFPEQSFLSSSH